jgi:hypothetical protein
MVVVGGLEAMTVFKRPDPPREPTPQNRPSVPAKQEYDLFGNMSAPVKGWWKRQSRGARIACIILAPFFGLFLLGAIFAAVHEPTAEEKARSARISKVVDMCSKVAEADAAAVIGGPSFKRKVYERSLDVCVERFR